VKSLSRIEESQRLQDRIDFLVQMIALVFLLIGSLWAQFALGSSFFTLGVFGTWALIHSMSFLGLKFHRLDKILMVSGLIALNFYFKNIHEAVLQATQGTLLSIYFPVAPQFFLVSALSIISFKRRQEFQVMLVTVIAWAIALFWTKPLQGPWTLASQWPTWFALGVQLSFLYVCWKIRESFRMLIRDHIKALSGRDEYRPKRIHQSKLQTLGELSASLAHEISNPLTSIKGYNHQIIEELKEPSPSHEILDVASQRIDFNVKRIMTIARVLRNFSRESSRDSMQSISLRQIFEDTLTLMSHPIKSSGVEFEVVYPENEIEVWVNPIEISQVLVNLLSNAKDACDNADKKLVRLGYTIEELSEKNHVIVWVEDSGPGLSQNEAEKIFQPFYTTKGVDKGTGLGLYIAQVIAERHESKIQYTVYDRSQGQAQRHSGTRFWLELKLSDSHSSTRKIVA
jgi:signal transduction histidine kinase